MFALRYFVALSLVSLFGATIDAQEARYVRVPIADLKSEPGFDNVPPWVNVSPVWSQDAAFVDVFVPAPAEAYWIKMEKSGFGMTPQVKAWGDLCFRVTDDKPISGRLTFVRSERTRPPQTLVVKFTFDPAGKPATAADDFYRAKRTHYERLLGSDLAGAAWFRHEFNAASKHFNAAAGPGGRPIQRFDSFRPGGDFDDTFSLVSGNRAVSENLQLDRLLPPEGTATGEPVALSSIEGVTTAEIDWKPLLAGKSPQLDPLAAYIPADQHVIFFSSFAAAMRTADEASKQGTSLLQAAEPQSQDAGTVAKYQRQLGLQTTALGRMLGPQVIKSVAVTGGDPYFRIGTDVALVFEAVDVAALRTALVGQIALNTGSEKNVEHAAGELLGIAFDSWRSPDRVVSSYLATYGGVAVVTNSPAQLKRLLETHQQKTPAVGALDEYKFFRDRYRRDDPAETGFVFLSDATIRRWCGPRWRIADSRRIRDLAVLTELQAVYLDKLANGTVEPGPIHTTLPLAMPGEIRLTADGVRSQELGSLSFMTPISELEFQNVGKNEEVAYVRWRDGYQRNFSWAFDPIGLRLTVEDERLAADLTVMPLIENTEYDELIAVTKGKSLKLTHCDPHESLLHGVLVFDKESPPMKQVAGGAAFFAPQLKVDILGWLGEWVAVYADDDPVWNDIRQIVGETMQTGGRESDMFQKLADKTGFQIPIALAIEVESAFKATAFLAAARGFIDQVGPGMTAWEAKQHGEAQYVKISPGARALRPGDPMSKLAIYYALTSESLTFSLSEKLIQRALDRHEARLKPAAEGAAAVATASPWLGEAIAFETDAKAVEMLSLLFDQTYRMQQQRLSWSNLPILNEWKRLFPQQDPAALHEKWWGVKLVCPAGGKYVWSEERMTMESTALGSPDAPKSANAPIALLNNFKKARYGLTFEEHGLRARGELLRGK